MEEMSVKRRERRKNGKEKSKSFSNSSSRIHGSSTFITAIYQSGRKCNL